jgi:hypothetical protein
MKKIMKYIISENQTPVFFSSDILHSDVFQNAKSAGFLSIRYDGSKNRFVVKCFGESESLKLMSNLKEDEKILEKFFND